MEIQPCNNRTAQPQTVADKRRALLGVAVFLAAAVALFFLVGKPMLRFAGDAARFRAWVDANGIWGRLAFVGMMVLQIIIAFIPGEPLEIAAGYAFGVVEGTLLCMLGTLVGGLLVFLFVRRFGMRVIDLFFSREKIRELRFLRDPMHRDLLTAILFFIPGTPKDVLTYFVGLTDMPLGAWLAITSLARIPSIITSTIGGNALGLAQYEFAILVFAATLLISLVGVLVYRQLAKRRSAPEKLAE